MDSEDEAAFAIDTFEEHQKRKFNWLNAENTRRRLIGHPPLTSRDPHVIERWAKMDARREEQIAQMASGSTGISTDGEIDAPAEEGQIEFHLPSVNVALSSTFLYDTFKFIAGLLNELEAQGENLIAYADEKTGETELSGETHSIVYDDAAGKWVVQAGRGDQESA